MYWFALLIASCALCYAQSGSRIVGGQYAKEKQFPHQVALLLDGRFHCGGSIISDVFIVTAAHCLLKIAVSRLTLVHGSVYIQRGIKERISKAVVHKNYTNIIDDIGLIMLKNPLKFTKHTKAILLRKDPVPDNSTLIISGFGQTGTFDPKASKLKFNVMTVVAECYETSILCINSDIGNGACFGDSGGPAVYDGKLVGITSFVNDGCGSEHPDGYTKVSYYYDWIIDHMEKMLNP